METSVIDFLKEKYKTINYSDFKVNKEYNFLLMDIKNAKMIRCRNNFFYIQFKATALSDYPEFKLDKEEICLIHFSAKSFKHQWILKIKLSVEIGDNYKIKFMRKSRSHFCINSLIKIDVL